MIISTDTQEYHREQVQMRQEVALFHLHYEDRRKVSLTEIPVFEQTFRERLDKAFGYLQAMTVEILGCTDEELNAVTLAPHAKLVVATVRVTREAFDFLRSTADTSLSVLCTQPTGQGLFAQQTGLDSLKDDIQRLLNERISKMYSVLNEEPKQWRAFTEAEAIFEDYERRIRDYDDLNIFEQLLTSNAHDQYEGAKNDAEQRRNTRKWEHTRVCELRESLQHYITELNSNLQLVTECSAEVLGVEKRVVNAKEVATELCSKTYDLENYLTTCGVRFNAEEVMTHILQLLYTSVMLVDSDMRVKSLKALLLGEVAKKYGIKKTEELKQNKKYLEILAAIGSFDMAQ